MFGKGLLPVTEYDLVVDRESGMPGFQPFEMMVSGRYIGEIVRLVCLDGITKGAWSFTCTPEGWNTKWAVQTATCSLAEAYVSIHNSSNSSNEDDSQATAELLNSTHPLPSGSYTMADAELFAKICVAVSTRSASLVATSTIALLQVNNELCKFPELHGSSWTCGSSSPGTPSPSDSGLGSMDEEIRWSRRGSIFSIQGSRRGSLASPNLLSIPPRTPTKEVIMELHGAENGQPVAVVREDGIIMEEPSDIRFDDGSDVDDDDVVVAFCGSVMEKYYTFRARCQKILDELVQHPCLDHHPRKVRCYGKLNGEANGTEVNGTGHRNGPRLSKVHEQRRVILEGNGDGGILGAGILAAVMDARELSASFAAAKQK